MIVFDDKIISDDVVEEQFVCDLNACKGACCVAGELGAPLNEEETKILEEIYDKVKPYLLAEGIAAIEKQGKWVRTEEAEKYNTPLMKKGGCAWMIYDKNGVVGCGIEKAYNDGVVDWKKPISCHLYPIRITKQRKTGYDMVNYERWNVCKAACKNGKALKVPVYKFLKDALIRKYGAEFYKVLELYVEQQKK
ncbi:MAG: DUF3109 family protein [Bacteroidota bacterium]